MNVTSITPPAGQPGAPVVIHGDGFGDPTVTFDGVEAVVVQWEDTSLRCVVPNLAPGPCTVTVSYGGASASIAFTVLPVPAALTIDSFFPEQGSPGTSVSISGSGFSSDSLEVFFNGSQASEVTVLSDSQLSVLVDENATTGDISITTTDSSTTSFEAFTVDSESSPPAEGATDPVQDAVTAAWQALFVPGPTSLPATLASSYPRLAVPDLSGLATSLDACDLCSAAGAAPRGPSPDGDATVTLADIVVYEGLDSLAPAGAPAFTASGSVAFPVTLGSLCLLGTWTVTKVCGGYGPTTTQTETGWFTVELEPASFALDASLSVDPNTGLPELALVAMVPLHGGFTARFAFSFDHGAPSWLDYLSGQWLVDRQIGGLVSDTVVSGLTAALLPTISTAVDTEIATLAGVTAS